MEPLKTLEFEPYKNHDTRPHCSRAWLMTPADVASEVTGCSREQAARLQGHWISCGYQKESTFALFRIAQSDAIRFRVSAFTSSLGSAYAVMTHQVSSHQHRFVLPLWDPRVCSFVRGMDGQRFAFSFCPEGSGEALVLFYHDDGSTFRKLQQFFVTADAADNWTWATEVPIVIATLGQRDAIPSLEAGTAVTDVSLSMVLPALIEAGQASVMH